MVTLTRITGAQFALNPDLIERVDCTPDTVITLVDGTKYLVRETLDEVVAAVRDYRARILGSAAAFERAPSELARRSRLAAVPDVDEEHDGQQEQGERDGERSDVHASEGPVRPLTPRSL